MHTRPEAECATILDQATDLLDVEGVDDLHQAWTDVGGLHFAVAPE
jgi:hypothetical protein